MSSPFSNDPRELESLIQEGIAASKSGDKRRAKQLLTQVVQIDPKSERAWLWLSDAVADVGFRRLCLEKVLAINPNNVTAQLGLKALDAPPAVVALPAEAAPPRAHPPEEAPPAADPSVRDPAPGLPITAPHTIHPLASATCPWCGERISSQIVLTCPACQHHLEFDCPECGHSLTLEARHCPRCGHNIGDFVHERKDYLSQLGEAYRAKGLPNEALLVYRYLLEIEPENPLLHVHLSEVYAQLEHTEASAAEAERAVELEPLNLEALSRLGRWYLNTGRADKASELAAQLTQLKPRPIRLTLLLGDLEYERGQYPAALRAYTQVRGSKELNAFDAPTRASLHFRLGELYRMADEWQWALTAYETCRDTQADIYEVQEAQAWIERIRPPLPEHALRGHSETLRAMAGPLLLVWLTGAAAIGFRFQHLTLLGGLGLISAMLGSYLFASAVSTPLAFEWREALGEAGLTPPRLKQIVMLAGSGLLILSLGLVLFGM